MMRSISLLKGHVLLGAILCLFLMACGTGNEFEGPLKNKLSIDMSGELLQGGQNLLVIDEADPKNTYCRIDSTIVFGFGLNFVLPDSLKDCGLKVMLKGKMRETEDVSYGSIALNLTTEKDSTVLWGEIKASKYAKQPNTWVYFQDSILISKDINKYSSKALRVFCFKNRGKGYHDVDDLIIEIIKE